MKFKDLEIETNNPKEESAPNRFHMASFEDDFPPTMIREQVREIVPPWYTRLYRRIFTRRQTHINENALFLICIAVLFVVGLLIGCLLM